MKTDSISRQAALDAICDNCDTVESSCPHYPCGRYVALEKLPPAQPKNQWFPCSDAPDTDRNVFIARGVQGSMTVCIGHYNHDYKQWYEDRNWFAKCVYDGLYWCEIPPLPDPHCKKGETL